MSTFEERVFLILLDRFQELKRMATAGLPVEIELEAVRSLLEPRLLARRSFLVSDQALNFEPHPKWMQ